MSNLETRPAEQVCTAGEQRDGIELLTPRDVPLGGPRAMNVRRTIPQRSRSLVGAWCFSDHYGPDDVSSSAGMQVPPHPHTGLQTVSWLFEGEILHRDSVGSLQTVRPGELNLMTAGAGISHSEESPSEGRPPRLHGVQLWTALPGSALGVDPHFEHHGDLPVARVDGAVVQVFIGRLAVGGRDLDSPATAYTPLVGAQIDLEPGAEVRLAVDPAHEHALLVDTGAVAFEGCAVPTSNLGYVAPGRPALVVRAGAGAPARAVLIGGLPFAEDVIMWWNFMGRTHEDIVRARDDWMAQVAELGPAGQGGATGYADGAAGRRFGQVHGYSSGPLRAPALPDLRLKPRARPGQG
ncbi:pirin family protein [Promicromonospora panici]|uniref:pirin family protein n=1 Tax=Promicromonospora panici TaxID=2219658 RepID=UPI00101DA8A6|nr:pirin family protein [Promicromonospora panici]